MTIDVTVLTVSHNRADKVEASMRSLATQDATDIRVLADERRVA
ncbi:hypothetical protein AB5I41_17395 [Sphingomonas sp. MMS24-JH45]